ncbi:hypothetical protein Tco_0652987 [Tanacetum coccineum]|uniref:Monodehydroascorbate reductase n=1 Tax=Tanacetum coccineum TaxID=301880 RepID=A0ABQ4WZF4_9ASTR
MSHFAGVITAPEAYKLLQSFSSDYSLDISGTSEDMVHDDEPTNIPFNLLLFSRHQFNGHIKPVHGKRLLYASISSPLRVESKRLSEHDPSKSVAHGKLHFSSMANAEQAPARASPVRTDEQIVPRNQWVPIGKSNCYLNEEKSQRNPIFKIAVDILKQTNFFRAFTASSTIPAIYIQQFWDTIRFDSKARSYRCQLDEQWFNLNQDTLRDALQITPVDNNRAFSSPPTPDTLVEFVNEALATIINLCLMGKTSGFERPRAPALQILWGIVNRAHIDYAERMWEEFTQSIHTFTEDKKKLAQHTLGKKKATLILIPSIRFTKLIIFHLQRLHNFHPRPESPLHLPTEEPVLGHLKFSAKGSKREVFGMTIPNELINDVIRGADYYDAYLEKVAQHQRYIAGEELSDPESPAPKPAKLTKQAKPKATEQSTVSKSKAKTSKPAPAKPKEKKRKPVSEPSETQPLPKRAKAGKVAKKRTIKSSKQLLRIY